jgi:hypothetical protein
MGSIFAKIAPGVVAAALFLGAFPGKGLRGAIVAIGITVAAAFILHFVAP